MENNSEYDIEPKNNRPSKVYGVYRGNDFGDSLNKKTSKREELLKKLELPNGVRKLDEKDIIDIIQVAITRIKTYINENEFTEEEYKFSKRQNATIESAKNNINEKDYLDAYFEIVDFVDDYGDKHDGKVYKSEMEEVQYLINLLEQAMPKVNHNEYNVEPKNNIPKIVYGVYKRNEFWDSLNKKISNREELLKKLELPNGVRKLDEKDIIDIIQVAITRIKAYANENEFTEEEYKFSKRQNATIECAINNINKKDYLEAYFEIVDFVDDYGDKHDGKVYKSEIDKILYLFQLIEKSMLKK